MPAWLKKHSNLLLFFLVIVLIVVAWLFPTIGGTLGILVLFLGFIINSYLLIKKHRKEYIQGRISRSIYRRKIILEITGILIAMVVASLIGRYTAEFAAKQITHTVAKFLIGIFVSFLAGLGVGFVIKKLWDGVQRRYVSQR